jgi:iron-sulfur cluster repair protein YtfE (RIC family)
MPHRNPALLPLTWEHRDVLGVLRVVRAAAVPSAGAEDLARSRELMLRIWNGLLEGHFADEETVMLPALRSLGGDGVAIAEQVEAEHARIAGRFAVLARGAYSVGPAALLSDLTAQVEAHLRFEEHVAFARLAAGLDAATLERLGQQLVDRRMRQGRGDPRERDVVRGALAVPDFDALAGSP